MKLHIFIIFASLALMIGCEIFVIGKPDGTKKAERLEIDRFTAKGSLMLFKTELDSSNIPAAARMLADSTGRKLPALNQYEMYNEMRRLKNLIGKKAITYWEEDSLSPYHYRIKLEVDSFRTVDFSMTKIDKYWYITGYK
jgi:hypothetical protein